MVYMLRFPEQWREITIDNVKPYYLISTYGNIFSKYNNNRIISHFNHNGYLQASLMTNDGGRIFRKVHRLVLLTFAYFPNCEELQVNHINGIKYDNYIGNLEWVTPQENTTHALANNLRKSNAGENNYNATISENDALQISRMILDGYSDEYIANIINCNKDIVRQIALGNTWKYLFSEDILFAMKKTRTGYFIDDIQKHQLCKFYQNHINEYLQYYNKAKLITEEALRFCGIEICDKSIRIARRLFFRLQNPDITSQYIY